MATPDIGGAVSEAREMISSRVAELEEELGHLQRALATLDGDDARVSNGTKPKTDNRRSKAKARKPVRGGKRAKRGQRQKELLAAIKEMPQAPVPELAERIGIPAAQVYGLVRKAETDKLITKKGQGFELTSGGGKGG